MDYELLFSEIIDKKYYDLCLDKLDDAKFARARFFEANAIGQIGEEFAKKVISQYANIINQGVIHDEYDIITDTDVKFEIKTARKGANNTFQFNGINPNYNCDYILCIGITPDEILYRIFCHDNIGYKHKKQTRGHYITQGNIEKKLVSMNPGNQVNHKLTLSVNDMFHIDNLSIELQNIFK